MNEFAEILRMSLRAGILIALAPFAIAFLILIVLQQVALGLVMIDSCDKPIAV